MAVLIDQSNALAQQTAASLIPEFKRHEAELVKKYMHNVRVELEEKGYNKIQRTGKLEGIATRTVIIGERKLRGNSSVKHAGEAEVIRSGTAYNFDELYYLDMRNGKYVIGERYFDSIHLSRIEEDLSLYGAFLPFSYNGWMRISAADALNAYCIGIGKRPPMTCNSFDIQFREGRNLAVLTTTTESGITSKNYYDPANNYSSVGYEMDKVFDSATKKLVNVKVVGEITYGPSDLGYPAPTKYVSNFVNPDGKFIPRVEVNFTKWERYNPTPDDFDLEKQFGVKPLPRPANAGPSPIGSGSAGTDTRGIGRWLWLAAGILVAITILLAVIVWRKRRKASRGG